MLKNFFCSKNSSNTLHSLAGILSKGKVPSPFNTNLNLLLSSQEKDPMHTKIRAEIKICSIKLKYTINNKLLNRLVGLI